MNLQPSTTMRSRRCLFMGSQAAVTLRPAKLFSNHVNVRAAYLPFVFGNLRPKQFFPPEIAEQRVVVSESKHGADRHGEVLCSKNPHVVLLAESGLALVRAQRGV